MALCRAVAAVKTAAPAADSAAGFCGLSFSRPLLSCAIARYTGAALPRRCACPAAEQSPAGRGTSIAGDESRPPGGPWYRSFKMPLASASRPHVPHPVFVLNLALGADGHLHSQKVRHPFFPSPGTGLPARVGRGSGTRRCQSARCGASKCRRCRCPVHPGPRCVGKRRPGAANWPRLPNPSVRAWRSTVSWSAAITVPPSSTLIFLGPEQHVGCPRLQSAGAGCRARGAAAPA
jgi:hypothetical protein